MLSRWPIRNKVLIGIGLLVVIVIVLSISGGVGVYRYRDLVRSLELRAGELPIANELSLQVSDLRVTYGETHLWHWLPESDADDLPSEVQVARHKFRMKLAHVETAFQRYREELSRNDQSHYRIDDSTQERNAIDNIAEVLQRIRAADREQDWIFHAVQSPRIAGDLERVQQYAATIPASMHQKLWDLRNEVRSGYRTLIALVWGATIASLVMFALFVRLFYAWVFRPLRVLIKGSRRVAAGEFNYRIELQTRDEMSELAAAMNDMTDRFQSIHDDLDRQVKERTKQVVRSEQLASVGFLAAGVAHEINNPLASIALCAESLETRVKDALDPDDRRHAVVQNYLRMIQEQAFRCKEITEKLLDFSRMGELKRSLVDLRELVQGVLDMVQHLGKYKDKTVTLAPGEPLVVPVNAQQLKQVVLNLVTNGLDAVGAQGQVQIALARRGDCAEIVFTDDGCGMTDEVLEHLFEPFYTRSRSGQGTGLGLSIVYSIVADHDGHIEATSPGAGRGSQFRVILPLRPPAQATAGDTEKELRHRYQAA